MQDSKNRQSSLECADQEVKNWWARAQQDIIDFTQDIYTQALRKGIAKEVARAGHPEGLMKSRLYMNGTLRSFIHYCQLRKGEETQKEHREIAEGCVDAISGEFLAFRGICDESS
jgi:thymidylate synthase (FAD)